MPTLRPASSELSSQESVNGDAKTSSHSQAPKSKEPLHTQSSRDALSHSADASRYLAEQDYNRALYSYQQALYLYQGNKTTVGECNAASTLHNMALLHKKCRRFDDAVRCFQEAEDLYRDCAAHVHVVSQVEEGQVCLDYLLIETLQNRALVHSKYQKNVALAISCHEQVVETILGMEDDETSCNNQREPPAAEDVVYVKMNNQQRVALLAESLKNLGIFYNQKGETEGALGALEEALEVLKCQGAECPEDIAAKKSMATVLINLASVFFGQEEFCDALEALQHAMDIWMEVEEDPARTDVLATVNNMGLAHERMGNLDKALECYEDLLHVRSQVLGSDHVEVADSLTTVAKVLERQGNAEGALDLYQEALRIYKKAANDEDPSLWGNAADVLGRIGTILLEMDQVDESIDRFHEALQMEHHTLGETSEETASIYHGLGRAYMAKCDYDEARECLLKAARMLEAVPNDGVHLDSLVESSEMLKQALNNESFLSSDGTWVNAEIDIQKTPERLALATSMSPIGESSLSADPDSTEDESPSDNFSSSSMSSQLPSSSQSSQLHVYVHPSSAAVDSSIEIEVSPLSTFYKKPPSSPTRNEANTEQEFDPYLSPASRDSASRTSDPSRIAIDARQASVLDTADINSPLRSPASGQGQEIALKSGPSDEAGPNQPDLSLPVEGNPSEFLEPSWAAAQTLANEAPAAVEAPSHIVEGADVDVSALASPVSSTVMGHLVGGKYATAESENETGDETEEEELQRGLLMEFSEYDSQSDMGTNTADYTNSSYVDETDGYTNDSDDVETAEYTNASDLDTASRQLSSVAEVDLSDSYNFTSDGDSQSRRLLDTSVEELTHTESELFPSEHESDAETDDRQLSTTYGDETISIAESNAGVPGHGTEPADFSSELGTESAYSASEPDMEGENDYRQLSTDNEESDVFGTDLDDDDDDGDYESVSLDESRNNIPRDAETLQAYRGASTESSRKEDPRGIPQFDVGPREERRRRRDPRNDEVANVGERPRVETRHYWSESSRKENSRRIPQLDVGSREERARRNDARNEEEADVGERPRVETSHHWPAREGQQEESDDNDPIEPLLTSSVASDRKPESPRDAKMSSPRVMLVKAFRHSFRRRRSRSRTRLDSMPENKEHHDPSPMVISDHGLPSQAKVPSFDPTQGAAPIGPIQFIDLQASSFDDNVSQITFLGDEASVRRRQRSGGSWWWGASSEGLEGWFPAVVGAAEEFLSAKTIHDQIKSRKRETSSSSSTDAESDIFGDLSVEADKEEAPIEEMSGHQIQAGDDAERDNEVDAEGHFSGMGPAASPSPSETKKSGELVVKSPATTNTVVPSRDASVRRRCSSPRTRPKLEELEKTLESQQSRLGRKHPDVAETLTIIAILKSQDGERDAPVELLHEALHIRKSVGDRAEFARTLHKLGDVYARMKEFKSSLSCHTDALHLERMVYGYQHPEVAKTLNKIGSVYAGQGEFGIAISNHQHALQILKDCVGEDLSHPLVAQTLICIGAVYYKERNSLATIRAKTDGYSTFIEAGMLDVIARAHEQRGSYRMAIAFFEEKLQLLRNQEKRGMDKQEVAEALTRLGTLSREAGLYLEALDYYDETANIQTALGRDQVEIAKGRLLKGAVLYHLGQYKGSLKLLKEAQTILQTTVGNDQQVLIAETFQWIGIVQTELCEYDSAMKALNVALKLESGALGDDHPATLKTRLAIATVLLNRAEMDASIDQLTAILETQGRVHGPKHPNLAETMYWIGRAYDMKGDITSAMKFFEESFFMAEKFLGHDHPSQASTLHYIADLQRKKRRNKKSLQLLNSVLTMRKDTLGEGHLTVAMSLCSIGACHAATGRFLESTEVLEEALPVAERAVGKTHPSVGLIHVTYGNLFLRKCQFEQAREMIERGIEIYVSSNVAKNHPHRLEAEEMLERVERDEALFV